MHLVGYIMQDLMVPGSTQVGTRYSAASTSTKRTCHNFLYASGPLMGSVGVRSQSLAQVSRAFQKDALSAS